MWKKALLALLLVCASLLAGGYLLPTKYTVEVDQDITASEHTIFVYIADLKRWREWQTWYATDPEMKITVSDPSYGMNAALEWKSEKVGHGDAIFAEWQLNRFVAYRLQIQGWRASIGRLEIHGAGVRWSMFGETGSDPFSRYQGLVIRYFVARDFKQGLERLKALIESRTTDNPTAPWDKN